MSTEHSATQSANLAATDRWRGAFVCAAVALCAVVYSFRLTSFLHVKELALCVALCAMAATVILRGQLSWSGCAAFLPLWVFLGCALAFHGVIFPAQVRSDALVEVARWVLLLLVTAFAYDLLAHAAWRQRITDAISASSVLVAVLGLIQYAGLCPSLFPVFEDYTQRVYSVFGNQDLYGGYLAIGAPLLVHRFLLPASMNWLALGGLMAVIPGLLISGCRSAWIAAAVGVALSIPYRRVGLRRAAVLAGVAVGLSVVTVWATPAPTIHRVTRSFRSEDEGVWARLWFWDGAVRMWRDRPVLGVGLGNYAYWSPRYLGEALRASGGQTRLNRELHTDHPHSEPLQGLAEGGLIYVLCWFWMFSRLGRTRGPEWGGLAALIAFALFNGPLQSVAHALAGLLLAAMLLARRPGKLRHSRAATYTAPAASLAVAMFMMWAVVLPSYRLRAAEDAHLAGKPCLHLYERAVSHPWPNAEAHKEYAIALAEAERDVDAYREFESALEGLDTGDVYLAMAILAAKLGDGEAATQRARGCLQRWPSNKDAIELLQAMHEVE